MPGSVRSGDLLADRYLVADLLAESEGGRFWRAHDRVLSRHVAVHVIPPDDDRAPLLMEAARLSATVHDRRVLRVLDADRTERFCYVVNEWGAGQSLDILLAGGEVMEPRRAAWLVSEVACAVATAHAVGVAHGRLIPENVLIDGNGQVRLIGLAVDAALHGLPPGRRSTDVVNLAALLYACLTARWPGVGTSSVPGPPVVGGQVLRPRRVRAGVPRVLDDLCDHVLNPTAGHIRTRHDLTTAAGIRAALEEFVGDATGMAEAEAARTGQVAVLGTPDPVAPEDCPPAGGNGTGPAGADPDATQAALPVFGDGDWVHAPVDRLTPFEQPADRPLFAPDPPEGQPARTPRPGSNAASGSTYWPWEQGAVTGPAATGSSSGWSGPGSGSWSGSGLRAIGDHDDEPVPGRSWMRLAMVIGVAALVLVATTFALSLGFGRSPLDDGDSRDEPVSGGSSTPGSPQPTPVTGLAAEDFDPEGDPPEENPDSVANAVDGDPATTWHTSTYRQNLGPGGIKSGVGITVDTGDTHTLSGVRLRLVGAPYTIRVFVSDTPPVRLTGMEPVVVIPRGGERARARFPSPVSARFVTIWLTSLPAVSGGYRGEIAEVEVLAE